MAWVIRHAQRQDLPMLDTALRALSKDLGDTHRASIDLLERAGFGAMPAYHALLAVDDTAPATGTATGPATDTVTDTASGVILFSPTLSTSLGATGLFVSDLWIAPAARQSGLGRRMLGQAAAFGQDHWGASYLKLAVYDGSDGARRFYDRLGFVARSGETTLLLDETGLNALKGT